VRGKREDRQLWRRAVAGRGPSDDDRPGVGGPSQAFDERELGDRTVAADFDIDPMAGSPDMRVAEAMVRRRVEALVRIDEADARDEDEEAGAEIAAEYQLIGGRGLGAAADLSAADLAEGFIECSWIRGRLRPNRSVEDPRRLVRVEFADGDLMQEIPEIRRIGRIGTSPPEIANLAALRVGQGKEPRALSRQRAARWSREFCWSRSQRTARSAISSSTSF
jgi:hypothetical protein